MNKKKDINPTQKAPEEKFDLKKTEEVLKTAKLEAKDSSMLRTFLRRFRRSKTAIGGAIALGIMFSTAIFAPFFTPYQYQTTNTINRLAPPTFEHIPHTFESNRFIEIALEEAPEGVDSDVVTFDGVEVIVYRGDTPQELAARISEAVPTVNAYEQRNRLVIEKVDGTAVVVVSDGEYGPLQEINLVSATGRPRNLVQRPSTGHILGTDNFGRDVWTRVLYGGRISLAVGFVAVGIYITIGVLVGSISGFYGGIVDDILMRFTEVIMVFPTFFLLLTVIAILGRSIFNIMVVIGITGWTGIARLVRAEFLSLRERDFTEAARAMGANDSRIIFKHILPNAMAPIIVAATIGIGTAILAESGLSFLGFGPPAPTPSWGNVLNDGRNFLRAAPWITTYPGMFIFITILGYNFMGDGLRDALDPRLKQ